MKALRFIFVLCCFFGLSNSLLAADFSIKQQIDPTKDYIIVLRDGNELFGKVLVQDSVLVIFKTGSIPKIEIPASEVVSLEESSSSRSKGWFENPNATRYLFGPSAYNLDQWEGYYQNT